MKKSNIWDVTRLWFKVLFVPLILGNVLHTRNILTACIENLLKAFGKSFSSKHEVCQNFPTPSWSFQNLNFFHFSWHIIWLVCRAVTNFTNTKLRFWKNKAQKCVEIFWQYLMFWAETFFYTSCKYVLDSGYVKHARQAEAPEGAAQFQLFKKVKITFWNLEKLKKREFDFFETSKSSKNTSLILCERKKAQKHHFFFFCNLKNAQKTWI